VSVSANDPFLRGSCTTDLKRDRVVWVIWEGKTVAEDELVVGFGSVVVEHFDQFFTRRCVGVVGFGMYDDRDCVGGGGILILAGYYHETGCPRL
jgi:hypothetical protein